MKMKRMRWILLALTLAALIAPVQAAGNGETTYRALLVGVDGYQTNALSGCVNDTNRMAATLQAANEAGAFYQSPVIRSNLQTDEIIALVKEMETWNVDEDDVTFVYFAGHGYMSEKGTPAIVGKDSKMLKISDMITLLDSIPGTKMVALDCRYADSLLSKPGVDVKKALGAFNTAVIDAFKVGENAANYYVFTASTLASSEAAALNPSEDPRGLVTYLLTQGCGYDYVEQRPTEELPADANENGAVSLSEVRDYVEAQIAALGKSDVILTDIQTSPEGSAYPVLARRATSEVLEVTLGADEVSIPVGRTQQLEAVTQPVNASRRSIYWTSSDLSTASVDDSGVVTGIKPGVARIAATTSNGLTVFADVEVRDVVLVESMTLDLVRQTVAEGSSLKLNLTVKPDNASEPISWTSSAPDIATVDAEGNVKCVGKGETNLIATSESGMDATCVLNVVEKSKVVTQIQLSKPKMTISEGEGRVVEAKVKPANAADPKITFVSSDPSIVAVSGDSVLQGVAAGQCDVYAIASSGVTAKLQVTVKGASIELSKYNLSLKKGKTAKLQTKVSPANVTGPVEWSSSDPAVATVENGKVTAVESGTAAITAKISTGAVAVCQVLVDGVPVKKVAIKPAKVKLEAGATAQLNATVAPANATIQQLTWKSGNENVVQVDDTGMITAISAGRAIVTGRAHNGAKAKCYVTVHGAAVGSVGLDSSEISLVAGLVGQNQATLTATTDNIAADSVSVKWASANPKIATVDKEGVVTARSAGKTLVKGVVVGTKKSVTCKVNVTGNVTVNKKPIVGDEERVYTSAKRIAYQKDNLVVQLYYANRSKSAANVPAEGTLMLLLSDGQILEVKQINAGNNKLKPGAKGALTYKVKVQEGDPLYGLDLRGAAAELVAPGEQPIQIILPLQGNTSPEPDAGQTPDDAQNADDADEGDEPLEGGDDMPEDEAV